MPRDTDTRALTLVDIPLVRRLSEHVTVLDSEIGYTRDAHGPNGSMLSSILLPQRGLYTLLARSDKQQVVGQFRLRAHEHSAQIVYIAPRLADDAEDTVWLHVLDAMAREAGKHKAHALIAEVDESSSLFETMRTCGFAVYARQQIWRRLPGAYPKLEAPLTLHEQSDQDVPGIQSLVATTTPPLMQQITVVPADMRGWIYRQSDRTEAYVAVSEGRHGVYLIPYLHPDISHLASAIFAGVIQRTPRANKLPLYVRVRRYQDWIAPALEALQFEPGPRQAVMVKHITAGVRHATFKPVEQEVTPAGVSINPPGNPLPQQWKVLDNHQESV
jgi:hypothetical protein